MAEGLSWLDIALPAALAGAIGVLFLLFRPGQRAAEARAQQMRALARRLGLRYLGSIDEELLRLLPECSLFRRGDEKRVANLMAKQARPPRLLLLDYEFTRGRTREAGLHAEGGGEFVYLVAMVRLPDGLAVTPLRVYREDWFGGPVDGSGAYRLKFHDAPDLSAGFLFAGEPRQAVEDCLTPGLREAILDWSSAGPRPVIEVVPGWVIVYAESERADRRAPERAESLLRYACQLAQAAEQSAAQPT